jgi:hypothetical protein
MEIVYNISDVKKFDQEVNSIRKGMISQTLIQFNSIQFISCSVDPKGVVTHRI